MGKKMKGIYKRCDNRWEGRYHKGRKANGQIKYGSVYGKTMEEVIEKLEPLRKSGEALLRTYGKSVMSFDEWGTLWLEEVAGSVKISTLAGYRHKVTCYLNTHFGKLSLFQITPDMISWAINYWQKDGLSNSSIKVILRVLGQSLKVAVKKGILTTNPCEEVQAPAYRKEKVRSLTLKEQADLEKVVREGKSDKSLSVMIALYTGLRIGEIAALKWADIDFSGEKLHISHTYQRVSTVGEENTTLHHGSAKSASSHRVIPIVPKIMKVLKRLKKKATSEFVFSVNGKPCEPRLLTYHFHRLREKANLGKIHFHQLRHSFATRCIELTQDVNSVSDLLGHSSTQMTLDIYTDALMEQKIQTIYALERIEV